FDRAGRYPIGLAATDSRGGVGAATLEIDVVEPGDTCATPIEIPAEGPFPYSVTVSTDLAGKEPNDPRQVSSCYPFTPQTSIWLSFTPPESGDYQFSLCGSEVSAVLVGYTGSCGAFEPNDLCIARSSSTSDCSSSLSTKTMTLNAGGNMRLLVSNYFSNDFGNVTVTVTKGSALSTIVTSVAPAVGPPGTAVVIDGIGFQSGATVMIGGVPAQDVTVVSPTIISATVPPSAAASANVSVQNPDGTSAMLANGFTVVPAAAGPKRRAVRR
ncbi:MAG: IPT/TIG domain-containing protein, partial [Thermoanaerobaculia bacterium]